MSLENLEKDVNANLHGCGGKDKTRASMLKRREAKKQCRRLKRRINKKIQENG